MLTLLQIRDIRDRLHEIGKQQSGLIKELTALYVEEQALLEKLPKRSYAEVHGARRQATASQPGE